VCFEPDPFLVSWWSGNGTAYDQFSGHDLLLGGGVTYTAARVGEGFLLRGGQWLQASLAADPLATAASAATLEGWVRADDLVSPRLLLDWQTPDGQSALRLILQPATNAADLRSEAPGAATTVVTNAVLAGSDFHHFALRTDPDSLSAQLYWDGQFAASLPLASTPRPNLAGRLFFGGGTTNSSLADFRGVFDEIGLFSRGLSPNEIEALYLAGPAGICSHPAPPVIVSNPASQPFSKERI